MDLQRRQVGAGAAMLVLLLIAVWLLADIGRERERGRGGEAGCNPVRGTGRWQAMEGVGERFARHGDDATRPDDWAGGDVTGTVRLPDGRILWLFARTLLGPVEPESGRLPAEPVQVRNSAVVFSQRGAGDTLLGGTDGRPAALFPSGAAGGDGGDNGDGGDGGEAVWRRPADAVVEPRRPGSDEEVVRVLLHRLRADPEPPSPAPGATGAPGAAAGELLGTEVATLSLPDLELKGIAPLHRSSPTAAREERVRYGTAAVRQDGWTYLFGAAPAAGSAAGDPSRAHLAHLARAPAGRLAEAGAWRYWDGSGWADEPSATSALDFAGATADTHGSVTGTYSVVPRGDAWLLLTMDTGGPDGEPSPTVVSYWACSPQGPWHGPAKAAVPPVPTGGRSAGATPRNPQGHTEFGGTDPSMSLLLSYGLDIPAPAGAFPRQAALHRPHFLRLTLTLVPDPDPDFPADPVTGG